MTDAKTLTAVDPSQQSAIARLGIISGTPGAIDAEGRVAMNHSVGRLYDALRQHVPSARLCMPILPTRQSNMNYVLGFKADAIVPLPPLSSTLAAQRHYARTRRTLSQFADESDVLFIRLPFQLPGCLRGLGTPKLLHVVSNPLEVIKASSDYRGLMRLLARRFARHTQAAMQALVAEPATRTVTNGAEMWQILGCRDGRVAVSSCIHGHEIRPRQDLRLGQPPRLLFVGYLRPEKGIESLLDAFAILRQRRPLRLTLVGGTDRLTGAEQRICQRISESPFRADIEMTGHLPYDERLFDLYRNHDIYVLPSLSEGTPRTLVEARCFGCPVVATRVGGIPSSVEHGVDGLLVEPNDPAQLAAAIEAILDNEPLRLRLMRAGIDSAQAHTLENFAAGLVAELELVARDALSKPGKPNR